MGVTAWLAEIGADPRDDEETRANKALLVLISVLILPVSLLWSGLYLAFGSPVGWVPLAYFLVLLTSVVVFSRTRGFAKFLLVGQLDILFAPTLSMIPLGGFLDSGGVGLWGILAPLGALVFDDVRGAARWYAAYLVVFLGSGLAGELLGGVSPTVPEWFTSTMLALNVAVGGTIVFTLLAVFARQRRDAQARADSLLLNILPRSIADRLKAETRTIADQFSAASILFADVVDSRRSRSACRRLRSSASSTICSATSTCSPSVTSSRRSRRSAIATWLPPASPPRARTMPERSP